MQKIWPVSSQLPVVSLLHEVHYYAIWVCTEARTVLRAVAADFFCNCWCTKIPSDNRIQHVTGCAHYHAQSFQLEAFQDFYVRSGSRIPELYSVSPDWFEYCFLYEKFVA
jgi:hypothetical protein